MNRANDCSEIRAFAKTTGISAAARFAQKIRPDFGFHDDDERRSNRPQRATHRNDPIERKVKDAVGDLQALARQALAGFGGGGNKYGAAGKATLQASTNGCAASTSPTDTA